LQETSPSPPCPVQQPPFYTPSSASRAERPAEIPREPFRRLVSVANGPSITSHQHQYPYHHFRNSSRQFHLILWTGMVRSEPNTNTGDWAGWPVSQSLPLSHSMPRYKARFQKQDRSNIISGFFDRCSYSPSRERACRQTGQDSFVDRSSPASTPSSLWCLACAGNRCNPFSRR